jgi:hypothetical protein
MNPAYSLMLSIKTAADKREEKNNVKIFVG